MSNKDRDERDKPGLRQDLTALIDSAKREGYEQGYVECGMKWNGVAEEVLSSMKETRKHMERTTAQLEQSEESI